MEKSLSEKAPFQESPGIPAITEWLKEHKPLGVEEIISLEDIDPKPWSGHFNYLVSTPNKKFILRFRGPEWGEVEGIKKEYDILRRVEPYAVGPRMYGFEEDFFGRPASYMEYLEGQPLPSLSPEEQAEKMDGVVDLIVSINKIPYQELSLPLLEDNTDYGQNKERWHTYLEEIEKDPRLVEWSEKVKNIIPRAEAMLDKFQVRLERVLKETGPRFIFPSSHAGHCFVTPEGLRFITWEKVGAGDPSFTLAVFLASLGGERASRFKDKMITEYLERLPTPEFKELVEQRLAERAVSDLLWVLWAYAKKKEVKSPEEATSVVRRFEEVKKILERYF